MVVFVQTKMCQHHDDSVYVAQMIYPMMANQLRIDFSFNITFLLFIHFFFGLMCVCVYVCVCMYVHVHVFVRDICNRTKQPW